LTVFSSGILSQINPFASWAVNGPVKQTVRYVATHAPITGGNNDAR
jgi:hypothetical protein